MNKPNPNTYKHVLGAVVIALTVVIFVTVLV